MSLYFSREAEFLKYYLPRAPQNEPPALLTRSVFSCFVHYLNIYLIPTIALPPLKTVFYCPKTDKIVMNWCMKSKLALQPKFQPIFAYAYALYDIRNFNNYSIIYILFLHTKKKILM